MPPLTGPFPLNRVCTCGHTKRHHSGNTYAGRCCVKPCKCPRFKLRTEQQLDLPLSQEDN